MLSASTTTGSGVQLFGDTLASFLHPSLISSLHLTDRQNTGDSCERGRKRPLDLVRCDSCACAFHTRAAKCWQCCSCNEGIMRAGRKMGAPPATPCAHPKPPPLGVPVSYAASVGGATSGVRCAGTHGSRARRLVCVCPVIRPEPPSCCGHTRGCAYSTGTRTSHARAFLRLTSKLEKHVTFSLSAQPCMGPRQSERATSQRRPHQRHRPRPQQPHHHPRPQHPNRSQQPPGPAHAYIPPTTDTPPSTPVAPPCRPPNGGRGARRALQSRMRT